MKNTFKEAAGQPDGVILSRARRHGDAPFGQPFAYTDTHDLTEVFSRPDKDKGDGRYPGVQHRLPWYKRLLRRKPPVAWAVVDPNTVPQAYLMHDGGEIRSSAVEPGVIVPVYDDTLVIAADEYERENPEEPSDV